jgi:hypothetical protein
MEVLRACGLMAGNAFSATGSETAAGCIGAGGGGLAADGGSGAAALGFALAVAVGMLVVPPEIGSLPGGGTSTTMLHFGQRAFFPAYLASTLNFVAQAVQRHKISAMNQFRENKLGEGLPRCPETGCPKLGRQRQQAWPLSTQRTRAAIFGAAPARLWATFSPQRRQRSCIVSPPASRCVTFPLRSTRKPP